MTLLAEAGPRSEYGLGYPAHVRREFSRFLACGQYSQGFARVKCADCSFERLLPFSCKGRSICPSCMARRMADTAAHLVDHVLPLAPYRQWTLSLPHDVRLLVVRNPDLLGRVLQLFLRAVFAYQRRRARQDGIKDPMPGAVTMLQFWGSVLQLTPHAHSWLPDGVLRRPATNWTSASRRPSQTPSQIGWIDLLSRAFQNRHSPGAQGTRSSRLEFLRGIYLPPPATDATNVFRSAELAAHVLLLSVKTAFLSGLFFPGMVAGQGRAGTGRWAMSWRSLWMSKFMILSLKSSGP